MFESLGAHGRFRSTGSPGRQTSKEVGIGLVTVVQYIPQRISALFLLVHYLTVKTAPHCKAVIYPSETPA